MISEEQVLEELNDVKNETLAGIGKKYNMSYFALQGKCIDDALELLSERKTRTLTLEELKRWESIPCWFESRNTYMGQEGFWIIPDSFTGYTMRYVFSIPNKPMDHTDSAHSDLGLGTYNKVWRCWTNKPTGKERQEIEWDD